MAKLRIVAEEANVSMTATLNESETAKKLLKLLPIESHAQIWGEEVYFETPLHAPEEAPHAEVPSGTVAYWPPGHAFCIFFGQEPVQPGQPPRQARQRRQALRPRHVRSEDPPGARRGTKAQGKEMSH